MKSLKLVEGYRSVLTSRETQRAIKMVKDIFAKELASALNLERISAPLFVEKSSGLNDDLNGFERKGEFDIKETGEMVEVVQSLAKWKRMALGRYGFVAGEGLYTDMNAIRRDDDMDNDHSIFVDQWDWERVIERSERNVDFLKATVESIVAAIVATQNALQSTFPALTKKLCEKVTFITSQELEDLYPALTPKQREYEFVREKKTVFIMQIGTVLKSGLKHDGRAPDYDDWTLNGDLLFWNDILEKPIEISSMGIRVDETSLVNQLKISGCEDRLEKFDFHKGIANGTLPLTIGGGIGQSRLCLLILEKLHVGEVQASVWDKETCKACAEAGVELL